jgi:hypothetical protein
VGTQIANNIVSFSNDGTMCIWDLKQFSKPLKNSIQLTAPRQTKSNNLSGVMVKPTITGMVDVKVGSTGNINGAR